MRSALLMLALLLLAGCSRPTSSGTPSGPASAPVASTPKQSPATSKPAATKPSIDDQPIKIPSFEKKFDYKLPPNGVAWVETSRPSKHNVTVTMKATPAGAKIALSLLLKTDFDAAKIAADMNAEPKGALAHNAGGDNVELKAAMPAVLPYGIMLRNVGTEIANVDLVLKAY